MLVLTYLELAPCFVPGRVIFLGVALAALDMRQGRPHAPSQRVANPSVAARPGRVFTFWGRKDCAGAI
jgi:hypothetical protein